MYFGNFSEYLITRERRYKRLNQLHYIFHFWKKHFLADKPVDVKITLLMLMFDSGVFCATRHVTFSSIFFCFVFHIFRAPRFVGVCIFSRLLYFVILFNTTWSRCFLWLKVCPESESIMDHIRGIFAGDLLSCGQWTRLPMGGVGE